MIKGAEVSPSGGKIVDDPRNLSIEYPIVEIFHSVQGEAFHAGVPHVFVRFGTCNLRCEWCDTDFLTYETMTAENILDAIVKFDCQRIIFTGGEPMLHDLWPLQRLLKARDYNLSVETNVTIEIPEGLLDWICVSPKDQMYPGVKIKQRTGDELKCVYVGQDLEMYRDLQQGFKHVFLQPCYMDSESVEWNGKNFAETEDVVKQNKPWRLSLQTHKWMGVD